MKKFGFSLAILLMFYLAGCSASPSSSSNSSSGNSVPNSGGSSSAGGNGTNYTVTYDANLLGVSYSTNGSIVAADTNKYTNGQSVKVIGGGTLIQTNTPALAACYFTGKWNTKADGSGTSYVSNDSFAMGSSNVTFYAVWITTGVYQGYLGGGNNGWQTNAGAAAGTGAKYLSNPGGICLDSSDNIYIADTGNHRVCKWTSAGSFVGWIGGGNSGWQTSGTASAGTNQSYFSSPCGVSVDSQGLIYVADSTNNRVCIWSSDGNFVGWIGGGTNGLHTGGAPSAGSGLLYLDGPTGVSVNTGFIFIADRNNNRLEMYGTNGTCSGLLGGGYSGWQTSGTFNYGTNANSFWMPTGVSVDSYGNIFVSDYWNQRLSFWNQSGISEGWIGQNLSGWQTTSVYGHGGIGSATGYEEACLLYPVGVYADGGNYLYIAESGSCRISKWSINYGEVQGWIGAGQVGWQTNDINTAYSNGPAYMDSPYGICVDNKGNIYVADQNNNRIVKWH